MKLWVYDPRVKWVSPFIQAARAKGWEARELKYGDLPPSGYVLFLPHAEPKQLARDKLYAAKILDARMLTDMTQVLCYDDKRAQIRFWSNLMPRTWTPRSLDESMKVLEECTFPLVSKADVGASSTNVRILNSPEDAERHLRHIFVQGVRVEHCDSQGTQSLQKDYAILQEFIPHNVTWRVNAIGKQRAIFKRHNYPDRPVAQTGNTEPVLHSSDVPAGLLEFCNDWFSHAGTQWCAVDVLWDTNQWRLLECSLRWPWPSPGRCMDAVFFPNGRRWSFMWDVLMDEIKAGAFG